MENHLMPFLSALGSALLWTFFGILAAIGALKLFDKLTPGRLEDHVFKEQNVSAAIIYAAVFLGACIIVASAMH